MKIEESPMPEPASQREERYKKALQFYADWNNWNAGLPACPGDCIATHEGPADFIAGTGKRLAEALRDHGAVARAALAESPKVEGKDAKS